MLGKHYLVYHRDKKSKRRQYTVCNVMDTSIYNDYIRVINAFLKSEADKKRMSKKSTKDVRKAAIQKKRMDFLSDEIHDGKKFSIFKNERKSDADGVVKVKEKNLS